MTLIIAGVGVANIMYVSIKERTREIGIKMAVGARRSYILVQFLIEALIITFGGGIGGILISYILTEGFSVFRSSQMFWTSWDDRSYRLRSESPWS